MKLEKANSVCEKELERFSGMREQLLSGQRGWGGTEGPDAPSMSGIWNRMRQTECFVGINGNEIICHISRARGSGSAHNT